jgi:hypothetical protein
MASALVITHTHIEREREGEGEIVSLMMCILSFNLG